MARGRIATGMLGAVLLAVLPKCLLCLLMYAGVASGLGWSAVEWCGPDAPTHLWPLVAGASAAGLAALWLARRRRGT